MSEDIGATADIMASHMPETDLVAGDRVSVHVSDLMLVPKTLEDEQED